MSDTTYAYPFDPKGTAASNRIQGERQTISPPGWSNFYFVIPKAAPYFRESLKVYHHPSGRLLVEGVDYLPTHRFHDASLAVGKPVFGSITFFDKTLEGVVELHYQTIGGKWVLDAEKILTILSDKLTNPRITTWEEVTELPDRFPVIDHEYDLVDMVGMSEVISKLDEIKDAIIASGEGGLGAHLADYNNPHQTTKAQVQLGNVDNFPTSTVQQATQGTHNASFMTPLRVAQAITAQAVTPLNAHIARFDNPHETTKAQVQLGNVQNYAIGTSTEAQQGTATDKYMTPSLVKTAITFQAVAPLNTHLADRTNPHQVTATQVGLGNVPNYPVGSIQDAREGTATDKLMTPALVRESITSIVGSDINNHVNNTNNPHGTTKAQVQLGNVQNFGLASQTKAEQGADNDAYMTPLSVKQAITFQVATPLNNHINDTNNPHLTTKAQVQLGNVQNFPIATMSQAEEGVSESAYMTPAAVRRAIQTLGGGDVAGHAARTDNPHQVTATQVGLGSVQNYPMAVAADFTTSATNKYTSPKTVVDYVTAQLGAVGTHASRTDNPHQVTAAQVGTYTTAQIDAKLTPKLDKTAKAADSALLDGKTAAQVAALASSVLRFPQVRPVGSTLMGPTWTKIGEVSTAQLSNANSFTALISGGEAQNAVGTSTVLAEISPANPAASSVRLVAGSLPEWRLGYRNTGTAFEIWVASPALRNDIAVFALRETPKVFVEGAAPVEAAPTNLTTLTTERQTAGSAEAGALSTLDLLEASVALSQADVTEATQVAADLAEDHHYFVKSYGATAPASSISNGLMRSDGVDKVYWDTYQWTNRKRMISPVNEALVNYTFETTITGKGSQGELGVIAAFVTDEAGKGHGIYLMRSDGFLVVQAKQGNVVGGSFYELMSVGYNLLELDALDMGSTSAGLKWGDNIKDEDRTADYDPATVTDAWGGLGDSFKVRVTKIGSMITIEASEMGSTDYATGHTFTIDLSLDPILNEIFAGPCRWGVVCRGLDVESGSRAHYEVTNRPGKYRRYVLAQNGLLTSGVYTGQTWQTDLTAQALNLTRSKLIFSEYKGQLFYGRADGTVKRLFIEADTQADRTVMSP